MLSVPTPHTFWTSLAYCNLCLLSLTKRPFRATYLILDYNANHLQFRSRHIQKYGRGRHCITPNYPNATTTDAAPAHDAASTHYATAHDCSAIATEHRGRCEPTESGA